MFTTYNNIHIYYIYVRLFLTLTIIIKVVPIHMALLLNAKLRTYVEIEQQFNTRNLIVCVL